MQQREIKFRAWCDKEMKYDWRVIDKDILGSIPLMQYTGLKDKNGKEIYEGDIVFKFGIDDAPYEIKYGEQKSSHDWIGIGFYTESLGEQCHIFGGEYIEIIGNIYENPELINNK